LGAVAAGLTVRWFPQVFLPFYSEGLYDVAANKTCVRALDSIRTIAPHVGAFFGFLCFEVFRRDGRAVALMLVMALGFAIPFAIGGYWHTFTDSALGLPWWKNWEMSIGLGGGLAFGLAFYLFNRPDGKLPPRPVTRNERIWGTALPVWLGCWTVLDGAYEGFRDLHGFEWPGVARVAVTAVYLLPMTALFIGWILQTRKLTATELSNASITPIPVWVLVGTLTLISIAGYATSIPSEIRMANAYLLTLYTGYLAISLILVSLLWIRQSAR
jgi:hypothetical protein